MKTIIKVLHRLLYVLAVLFGGLLFILFLIMSGIEYILTGKITVSDDAMDKYENWCENLNPER